MLMCSYFRGRGSEKVYFLYTYLNIDNYGRPLILPVSYPYNLSVLSVWNVCKKALIETLKNFFLADKSTYILSIPIKSVFRHTLTCEQYLYRTNYKKKSPKRCKFIGNFKGM